MVLVRELIKQERLYAREITRVFDRAVSALDPTRRVNLTRAIARPAIKAKIQTATLRIFKQGVVSAEDEIKQALKRASAATIDTTLNDFESGIAKIYAEDTTEYMGFLSKEMQDQMNVSLAEGHVLGESIPKLSRRLEDTWRLGKVRAVRYARTQTNDVYNAAHMSRYASSSVVEYVQFSAHLDDRTSPICRMYHKTIWRKNDPGIQIPPLHFNCRSRIVVYFGKFPGERDFKILSDGTEIIGKEVKAVDKMLNTFKTKYWKSSGEKALKKAIQAKSKVDVYKVLASEEDKIRNNAFETGVVVDSKTGKLLLRKAGNHNSVSFDANDAKMFKGNIASHNHPGSTSFSQEDIRLACYTYLPEMRVVSSEYSYIMKIDKPYPGLWDDMLSDLVRSEKSYQHNKWDKLIQSGEMTTVYANKHSYHEIWHAITKDLDGITYERIKT